MEFWVPKGQAGYTFPLCCCFSVAMSGFHGLPGCLGILQTHCACSFVTQPDCTFRIGLMAVCERRFVVLQRECEWPVLGRGTCLGKVLSPWHGAGSVLGTGLVAILGENPRRYIPVRLLSPCRGHCLGSIAHRFRPIMAKERVVSTRLRHLHGPPFGIAGAPPMLVVI